MKSVLLFFALLGAITLSSSLTLPVTGAANPAKKQQAMFTFNEPVKVMDVTLKGQYLFVHDDAAMARGEACTYIYKGLSARADKLATSFHCIPAVREKANYFIVRTVLTTPGTYELKEFQFAGSTEAHMVPINLDPGHVHLAN